MFDSMASFSVPSQAATSAGQSPCFFLSSPLEASQAGLFSQASFGAASLSPRLRCQRATTTPNDRSTGRRSPVLKASTSLHEKFQEEEEEIMEQTCSQVSRISSVVTITIPEESFGCCFESDYGSEAATWPEDLGTTRDYRKIEEFVASAHALVRRWLMPDVVARLERFVHDPSQPPVLVIRGLPVDADLAPTADGCPGLATTKEKKKKAGSYVSETWLVGISRVVGQPFLLHDAGLSDRSGLSLLVRDLCATPVTAVEQAGHEGSCKSLDFHVDFFQVKPESFPNVLAFIGVKGDDAAKAGRTMVCDFRKLYAALDLSHIKILRKEKITWEHAGSVFSKCVIEGPEDSPIFNLFEESLLGLDGFDKCVSGSLEGIMAYKQVKEIAKQVGSQVEGVQLAGGDICLINQRKVAFSHTSYTADGDRNDQWIQHTYINEGTFWLPRGLVPYPIRTLPMVLQ